MLIYINSDENDDALDYNLSKEGYRQSKVVALTISRNYGYPGTIYSSPYTQSRVTTDAMLSSLPPTIKGKSDPTLAPRTDKATSLPKDTLVHHPPLGESLFDFKRRVKSQLTSMKAAISKFGPDYVIWCITHGTFLRELSHILEMEPPNNLSTDNFIVIPCSESVIDLTETSINPNPIPTSNPACTLSKYRERGNSSCPCSNCKTFGLKVREDWTGDMTYRHQPPREPREPKVKAKEPKEPREQKGTRVKPKEPKEPRVRSMWPLTSKDDPRVKSESKQNTFSSGWRTDTGGSGGKSMSWIDDI